MSLALDIAVLESNNKINEKNIYSLRRNIKKLADKRKDNMLQDMIEALEDAEDRDNQLHDFDDLQACADGNDTDYMEEYQRRQKRKMLIAQAKDLIINQA